MICFAVIWRGRVCLILPIKPSATWISGSIPRISASASNWLSDPSSSRIFVLIFCARYSAVSRLSSTPLRLAFASTIAQRVSKSGIWISIVIPHSNLLLNRSVRVGMLLGGLSELIIICLLFWCSSLNVWKNSSWVFSLPAINCISSTIKTSTLRYLLENPCFLNRMWSRKSFIKFSVVVYNIWACGLFLIISLPVACIKWVLPKPTPPYKNRGLYFSPGWLATAWQVAYARSLLDPTIKLSNV